MATATEQVPLATDLPRLPPVQAAESDARSARQCGKVLPEFIICSFHPESVVRNELKEPHVL